MSTGFLHISNTLPWLRFHDYEANSRDQTFSEKTWLHITRKDNIKQNNFMLFGLTHKVKLYQNLLAHSFCEQIRLEVILDFEIKYFGVCPL